MATCLAGGRQGKGKVCKTFFCRGNWRKVVSQHVFQSRFRGRVATCLAGRRQGKGKVCKTFFCRGNWRKVVSQHVFQSRFRGRVATASQADGKARARSANFFLQRELAKSSFATYIFQSRFRGRVATCLAGGRQGKGKVCKTFFCRGNWRKVVSQLTYFNQGSVAEWLGRGLQNLLQRFESARNLNKSSRFRICVKKNEACFNFSKRQIPGTPVTAWLILTLV